MLTVGVAPLGRPALLPNEFSRTGPSPRRLPEDDLNVREVRISCPDATGLGVDLTRVLLDFGLRILQGDISTDGKWCFMVFRVQLSSGVPPRWQLLRARLGSMCPNGTAALDALWRWRSLPKEHPPFLLQVASYDRQGMLHSLTHVLWESDATVRQGGGGEGVRAGGKV